MRPDVLAALLLIVGGVVGSQFATDLGSSLGAILRFGLAAVGVPLVFVAVAPAVDEIRILSWAFVAGASINSIVGVATYDPLHRGIGLSVHSNHLAIAALLASGLAAGLCLTGSRRSSQVATVCWGILTVGILKSGSRAGIAGALIVIVLVLLATQSIRILRWCLVIALCVIALVHVNVIPYDQQDAMARLLGRNSSAVSESNAVRAQLRAKAVEGVKKHPLTGAGFEQAREAHNLYLQVWGAAGIVGLLGMAVLWNAGIQGILKGMSGDRWVLGAAAGVASYLVVAVASNILWDRYLWYAFALLITGMTVRAHAVTGVGEKPFASVE